MYRNKQNKQTNKQTKRAFQLYAQWLLPRSRYVSMFNRSLATVLPPCQHCLYYIYHKAAIYNLTTLCLNGTLSCVDFMDVIMGDIPYITTLCLNGTLSCDDFMDVIMGDIPYITTLCLNGTLSCVDFMDVIMGDIPYITTLCLNGTLPCDDFMDVIMGDITEAALP